ncbi:hypothetical protein GGR21_001221 [Dysgonomonas hofstadii]|uniref:Uncharacterized protein n=1 Tax=Dysgonomonas hofstadii TaxID=637886 RepID=A0A840CS25_9BACT|nr:hypothetical protein [Dysgonomonas hofstadii]
MPVFYIGPKKHILKIEHTHSFNYIQVYLNIKKLKNEKSIIEFDFCRFAANIL